LDSSFRRYRQRRLLDEPVAERIAFQISPHFVQRQ
jgi:hypothetical protein